MNNLINIVLQNLLTEKELQSLDYYVENIVLTFDVTKNGVSKNNLHTLESYYRNMTFGKFAWLTVQAFDYLKEFETCKKFIRFVEDNISELDPTEKIYFYKMCFNLYYKPRNKEICNYTLCERYCLSIFDNWEEFEKHHKMTEKNKLVAHYDTQLKFGLITKNDYKNKINNIKISTPKINFNYVNTIKVYEKLDNYEKAIEYCTEALTEIGNFDGTKGGFTARYSKLLKKLNKKNKK